MKHLRLAALLGAVTFLGIAPTTFAQTAEPPALVEIEAAPNTRFTRVVKIKNVPSALIAYQLDPKHNPRPAILGDEKKMRLAPVPPTDEKGAFDLPDGIEQIVSIAPQNVLLISGGNAGDFQRLQELISVLDQPLRQVEIEAQSVEVSAEYAKQFGIDFSQKRASTSLETQNGMAPVSVEVGFLRNNFSARLKAAIAAGKAKVLTAPRVTAINNLSATMDASVEIGELSDGKRAFKLRPVGVELNVVPTINGDDTVTLLLEGTAQGNVKVSGFDIIANLRDGDTIALAGLSPLFAPAGTIDPPNVLVFLTARIVRRAGDAMILGN